MCGIVGYIGETDGFSQGLEGLKRLEYRGYDSSGLAYIKNNKIKIVRSVGKIENLVQKIQKDIPETNQIIYHTRWATHGVASEQNAHPHLSEDKKIALVHNGIIENYAELRTMLEQLGYSFKSETDTEVIVNLIQYKFQHNLVEAVRKACKMLQGSYAIAVIYVDKPDIIVVAKKDSPLVIGLGDAANYISSDPIAISQYTKDFIYLSDGETGLVKSNEVSVYDKDGTKKSKPVTKFKYEFDPVNKGKFPHYMLKEIFEQSQISQNIIDSYVDGDGIKFPSIKLRKRDIRAFNKCCIIACGTSYHAGLVAKYWFEKYTGIAVDVEFASEFRYKNKYIDEKTLVIPISQSGETADTIAAIKEVKKFNAKVLCLCNVDGSTLTRMSDSYINIQAGVEIGVASTKAFTAQLHVLFLLSLFLGNTRKTVSLQRLSWKIDSFKKLPGLINEVFKLSHSTIQEAAKTYASADGFIFIGRNLNYPIALEGALKLKEISYIHAEGHPAGEMKHGPIALIHDKKPIVCITTKGSFVNDKMLSNIEEAKARKGNIILITDEENSEGIRLADHTLLVPSYIEELFPMLSVIPCQLLAYYIALENGHEIDKPRNLAKSVTVE